MILNNKGKINKKLISFFYVDSMYPFTVIIFTYLSINFL